MGREGEGKRDMEGGGGEASWNRAADRLRPAVIGCN